LVDEFLPEKEPWIVMEALIELGALICRKKPECSLCPMRLSCRAYEGKNPQEYPVKKLNPTITKLYHLVCLIEYKDKLLLYQEKDKSKRMADLWGFPFVELEDLSYANRCPDVFSNYFKIEPQFLEKFPVIKQSFTRYQAQLLPLYFKVEEQPMIVGYHWIEKAKLLDYPFSSGHKKIAAILASRI
jgi:A/G-specific adenine glycosylase